MKPWEHSFEARCVRSGQWWSIGIFDDDGTEIGWTQVRRLSRADYMARDALSLLYEAEPELFDITVVPQLGARLERRLDRRRTARERARAAAAMAAKEDTDTARALVDAGLSYRDAGIVMGVAFQRVAQLVASKD